MLTFDFDKTEDQERFYDTFMVALCLWREARGEPIDGKVGVAWTIKNRAAHPSWWGGPSLVSVITKPKQFSSFNSNDPNAVKFPKANDTSWMSCLQVCDGVLNGSIQDPTGGATHYHDTSIEPPAWTQNMRMVAKVSKLIFYR